MTHRPLTRFSEDESMFQEAVRAFARAEVRPLVEKMDAAQTLDRSIIDKAFALGLMGIEVPEEYGGSGSSFMTAILAIEELAVVDPSVSVFVDVQNTLV